MTAKAKVKSVMTKAWFEYRVVYETGGGNRSMNTFTNYATAQIHKKACFDSPGWSVMKVLVTPAKRGKSK